MKSKNVTLQDVARHAGVSRATASRIVRGEGYASDEARQKVLAAMEELGYIYDRNAANLRSRQSGTVGFILSDIDNPVYGESLVGISQKLDEYGYTLILGTTFNSVAKQDAILAKMLEYRVDGLLMVAVPGSDGKMYEKFSRRNIPIVYLREPPNERANYVGVDNRYGAKMATEHLLRLGRRRIAYVGGLPDLTPWKLRRQGYADALREHGLEPDEQWIVCGEATRVGGISAFESLVDQAGLPDAVLCFNDMVAFGVLHAIREKGLVPGKDIAVVGFDNVREAAISYPRLTTVSMSYKTTSILAAQLLHERIIGVDTEPKQIILKPELVIRESCSAKQDNRYS
jgi:LacI family transcriptional regulator